MPKHIFHKYTVLLLFLLMQLNVHAQLTWSQQISGTTTQFIDKVDFVNASVGYTLKYPDGILSTVNGGQTWTNQTIAGTDLNSISFVDELTGWAVDYNSGTIYKTINGGSTWFTVYVNPFFSSLAYDVFFIDQNFGWVTRADYVLFTDNGGSTWDSVPSFSSYQVQFVDQNIGFLLNSNILYKSTNGGLNWSPFTIWSGPGWISSFYAIDATHLWAVGDGGLIRTSSTGGASWSTKTSGTATNLNGIQFYGLSDGVAVGDAGTILTTNDGGNTWIQNVSGVATNLYQLDMVSAAKVWITGESGVILSSDSDNDLIVELYVGQDSVCKGVTTPISISIKNNGYSPVSSVDFHLSGGLGATLDYAWNGPLAGGQSTSINLGDLLINATDTYTLTFTGDSIVTNNSFVFDIVSPVSTSINTNGPFLICQGEQVELIVSGGTHYEWIGMSIADTLSNLIITPTSSAYYSVNITDEYDCVVLDSIHVELFPESTNINTNGPFLICPGDVVELIVSGGTHYEWNGMSIADTLSNLITTPTSSAYYSVKITDEYACVVVDSIYVELFPESTNISTNGPFLICPGDATELTVSGGLHYAWEGMTAADTLSTLTVMPELTTYYAINIINEYGCPVVDSILVETKNDCQFNSTAFSPNGDGKNDFLFLDNVENTLNTVVILNRWGDEIITFENYNNVDILWDGSDKGGSEIVEGTYFYTLEVPATGEKKSGWVQLIR